MLYHIPIEPYENRYTADWIQQFEKEFEKHDVPYITILGEQITNKIKQGSVLDACGTHIYKFSQLEQLIKKINNNEIKNGDIIFFSDLWFPGIESLFYIRNITKIQYKIVGIFHSGTYDKADFTRRTGMRDWGKYLENCWFKGIDLIFLQTNFHKQMLLSNASIDSVDKKQLESKIKVTGEPFYANDFISFKEKENIVVFPHRLEKEKHPEMFDLFSTMKEASDYKFIKTMEVTKNRKEYFDLLAKSKIMLSFADQETFGYSTLEAMALGNIVIVPNKLSYKETVPEHYRYNNLEEAKKLFTKAIKGELIPYYPDIDKWEKSFNNIYNEMKKENWNV